VRREISDLMMTRAYNPLHSEAPVLLQRGQCALRTIRLGFVEELNWACEGNWKQLPQDLTAGPWRLICQKTAYFPSFAVPLLLERYSRE
jgi:hypothetical protein